MKEKIKYYLIVQGKVLNDNIVLLKKILIHISEAICDVVLFKLSYYFLRALYNNSTKIENYFDNKFSGNRNTAKFSEVACEVFLDFIKPLADNLNIIYPLEKLKGEDLAKNKLERKELCKKAFIETSAYLAVISCFSIFPERGTIFLNLAKIINYQKTAIAFSQIGLFFLSKNFLTNHEFREEKKFLSKYTDYLTSIPKIFTNKYQIIR